MAVQILSYGPPIHADTVAEYKRRGLHFSGLTYGTTGVGFLWDDFERAAGLATDAKNPQWLEAVVSTGAGTGVITGGKGGLYQCSTGATAASNYQLSTRTPLVSNITTDRWYIACRYKVTTTPDAATLAGIGWLNQAGDKTVLAGVNGSLSATKFVVQYDGLLTGSVLDTGTVFDTSFHTYEVYGQGSTTLRGRFDGGAELSAVMTSAPSDYCRAFVDIRNGVTAAAQTMQVDWVLILYPR